MYFNILDDLKDCNFKILKSNKFFYLKPVSILSDYDGLVEINDDGDVQTMFDSYKTYN